MKFAKKGVKKNMQRTSSIFKGVIKMKKVLVFILLASLVMCLPASALKFKDLPDNHWAASAVYDLVKRGITDGFPDGTFRGNEKLSRYQTAVFLAKMAKSIESKGVSEAQVERLVNKALAKRSTSGDGATVSGTIFASYTKGLSNSTVINNFDVTRAYLTVEKGLGDNASAKLTLDAGNAFLPTIAKSAMLKYAYVDLKDTLSGIIPGVTVDARLGLQPTYWVDYVDGILDLRVVSASLAQLSAGSGAALIPSDMGLGAMGVINVAGLPEANYTITALNGAGNVIETDAAKTLAGRVDSEVAPGVTVAFGAQISDIDRDGTGSKLANALVAYKADQYEAYGELMYGQGGIGYSAAGTYNITDKCGVFGRVDIADPSRDVSDDQTTRLFAGVVKKWNPNVKLIADIEGVTVGTGDMSTQVALRTQIDL
jgi:S-layer homology domain